MSAAPIDTLREQLVREIIAEQVGIEPAAVGDRLLQDELGLDALDVIEVAISVETMCDVAIVNEADWLRPSCIVRAIADAKAG